MKRLSEVPFIQRAAVVAVALVGLMGVAAARIRAEERPTTPLCGNIFCADPFNCQSGSGGGCSYMPLTNCRCDSPSWCVVLPC
jgi:hypothetical protein